MIDIDHFKKYNDTHGHDAGDFVLVEISDLLCSKLREGDIACRYGGEELVMVMLGATKEITAARAELMREAIEKHHFLQWQQHALHHRFIRRRKLSCRRT